MVRTVRLDEVQVGMRAKFPMDDGVGFTKVRKVEEVVPGGYVLKTEARTYPACWGEAPVSVYEPGDPMFGG